MNRKAELEWTRVLDRHKAASPVAAAALWSMALVLGVAACGNLQPDDSPAKVASAAAALNHDSACQQEYNPPPPPGPCKIEVRLEEVKVTDGQGLTEGKLELNVGASVDGGGSTYWPGKQSTQKVKDGYSKTIDQMVQVIELAHNEQRNIDICTEVTEYDNGWANGDSDVARGCKEVSISCFMAPSYFSIERQLCKGDKREEDGSCKTFNGAVSVKFSVKREDADGDGVSNEEDFTPDPCDEQNLGQRGRAVLVYFHMGDKPTTTLFQELGTNLDKAMQDYDYIVLLKEDNEFLGLTLSPAAVNQSNLMLAPTYDNFFYGIKDIVSKGYDLDIFIWSHGALHSSGALFVTKNENVDITSADIEYELHPSQTGAHAVPIRMIYSVACYHEAMNPAWRNVGAKVSSGPRGINFYPTYYGNFIDDWNSGSTYLSAINAEATSGARTLANIFVQDKGSKATHEAEDNGTLPAACDPDFDSVLGLNACAEWYFENGTGDAGGQYDFNGAYDPTISGEDNMINSSERFKLGNGTVTKFGALTW